MTIFGIRYVILQCQLLDCLVMFLSIYCTFVFYSMFVYTFSLWCFCLSIVLLFFVYLLYFCFLSIYCTFVFYSMFVYTFSLWCFLSIYCTFVFCLSIVLLFFVYLLYFCFMSIYCTFVFCLSIVLLFFYVPRCRHYFYLPTETFFHQKCNCRHQVIIIRVLYLYRVVK